MKPIEIVYYSQPIDNWGRVEASAKGPIIHDVLVFTEHWTDEMSFEDVNGKIYSTENLKGKEVSLEDVGIFTVPFYKHERESSPTLVVRVCQE